MTYNSCVRTEGACGGGTSPLIQGYRHRSFAFPFVPSTEVPLLSGLSPAIGTLLGLRSDERSQFSKKYSLNI